MRRALEIGCALAVGAVLIFVVSVHLLPFGSFPRRVIGEKIENSIGQRMLENGPAETGSANVVTSVVWDYRAYDTLGEATVLFTAVCGVLMLFLATRRRS